MYLILFMQLISESVRQVILDIKVGPPLYEQGLAEDTLSIVSSYGPWQSIITFSMLRKTIV